MTSKYFCVLFHLKAGPFRHFVSREFADKSLECVSNGLSFFFFFDDLHKKCIQKPHFFRANLHTGLLTLAVTTHGESAFRAKLNKLLECLTFPNCASTNTETQKVYIKCQMSADTMKTPCEPVWRHYGTWHIWLFFFDKWRFYTFAAYSNNGLRGGVVQNATTIRCIPWSVLSIKTTWGFEALLSSKWGGVFV